MTPLAGESRKGAGWKRWLGPAGALVLWLALSVAFLRLPVAPPADSNLDASWALSLSYMAAHRMQFGTQVVFTFGPLGFLMNHFYCGSALGVQAAASVVTAGVSAWILLRSMRPLGWPARTMGLLASILLISQDGQVLYLLMIVLIGLFLLNEKGGIAHTVLCGILLGLFSLIKFTNLMLAASVVAAAVLFFLTGKNWRRATVCAGSFILALPAWWIACGQAPSGLLPYFVNSLEISKGFEEGMAIYERPLQRALGVAMVLLLAAYGAFEAAAAKWRIKPCAMILMFWTATYLFWKHGFIRADRGHMLGLFVWALAPVTLNQVLFPRAGRWMACRTGFLALIALCSVIGIVRLGPETLTRCLPAFWDNFSRNIAALCDPPAFKRSLDASYAAAARANAAPRIVQAVGSDSVDALGFEQAPVIFNGLHYTPRPVFQSYSAYTPRLAALNAAFLSGDRAPEWILQQYGSMDHRYPPTDDGSALRALLDHYTFQFEDSGYLVWRRAGGKDTALPPPIREGDAAFNQDISAGDIPAKHGLWLEVEYSYSLAGSLLKFVYKPPAVNLSVTTAGQPDSPQKFRFPRLIGEDGVLLSPYLDGPDDFLRYAAGLDEPKVLTFRIKVPRDEAKYLKRIFHYRLIVLPEPGNFAANQAAASHTALTR